MLHTSSHLTRIALKNPSRLFNVLLRRIGLSKDSHSKQYSTYAETQCLMKYAKQAKRGIVEIGLLDGGNTREMGLVASVPIYGIDPLIIDSMSDSLIGSEEAIRSNMSFYKEFYFYKDYSYNVVKKWKHEFDFIWIDGDHTYNAVRKDFEDWFPLLEDGGYIAFHDSAPVTSVESTHHGYEGPIKLVNELKNNNELKFIETQDSISLFKKVS